MIPQSASRFGLTAALALSFASAAPAAEANRTLPQLATFMTDLGGGTTALVYWVDHAGVFQVVTTVDTVFNPYEAGAPRRHVTTRFTAAMAPGQLQVISVPGLAGSEPRELRIRRVGDRMEVTPVEPRTGS